MHYLELNNGLGASSAPGAWQPLVRTATGCLRAPYITARYERSRPRATGTIHLAICQCPFCNEVAAKARKRVQIISCSQSYLTTTMLGFTARAGHADDAKLQYPLGEERTCANHVALEPRHTPTTYHTFHPRTTVKGRSRAQLRGVFRPSTDSSPGAY